jgi:putative acetyltransferase
MIDIRQEIEEDREAVHQLYLAAFDKGPEAALVDRLRAACGEYLAFVAVEDSEVVGHILFTPVTLDTSTAIGMGLAPMAVMPSQQRKGIGSRLVRHGLEFLRKTDYPFVIVLGHPDYYPRFGFEVASHYGLRSQWEGVPEEAFLVVVFDWDALPKHGGVASYRKELNDAM